MVNEFDFGGWATKTNIKCSDGLTITKDAFKHNDGKKVPLIWMHKHKDVVDVLGHAILEHRDEGIYAYCKFNDTESGKTAKQLVQHGDIDALSIFANQLQKQGSYVMHGNIREVSLVLAGANPGASIQHIIKHSDDLGDIYDQTEAEIFTGENFTVYHSDEEIEHDGVDDESETIEHADKKEDESVNKDDEKKDDKTIKEVIDSMTEEQKTVLNYIVGCAVSEDQKDEDEEGDNTMKHNLFDQNDEKQGATLSHADEVAIVNLAKQTSVGSLKSAISEYFNDDTLEHGAFESYEELFPEYELLKKGEPETIERDQSWISHVMKKIHKSPIARIRTRQANAKIAELRANGYQKKGDEKTNMAKIKLLSRTTDPQTVYIKDDMHRDDIIDITDFDVVAYQWRLMRHVLDEELALAALIGDGREDGDPDKIHEDHIRSIWNDEELYTIHADVDLDAMKQELQGTNTSANFGDNYVMAEAVIQTLLYAHEKYKGSGHPDFYCTPHVLNVMLLARDLNGRRIYSSKADLVAALNVNDIITIEQFEGKTRTTKEGDTKKLLGIYVNMADYQFGSSKGGEITKFEDFDIDFNRYQYMLETRLSGSLNRIESAIALEMPVVNG